MLLECVILALWRRATISNWLPKIFKHVEFIWVNTKMAPINYWSNFGDRVKFPYGTEEEMQQMENALQTAFNDVQSNAALKRVSISFRRKNA
jgi:hypothetical protein